MILDFLYPYNLSREIKAFHDLKEKFRCMRGSKFIHLEKTHIHSSHIHGLRIPEL